MREHGQAKRTTRALLLQLALLIALSARLADSQSPSTTCYGLNGIEYPKQVRCPGSLACCGDQGSCLPNRLCHRPGLEQDVFIRGTCAVYPYDAEKCARICTTYNETEHDGIFPRVDRCDDGSYCCRDVVDCCARGAGIFLDGNGNIIDEDADSLDKESEPDSPRPPRETNSPSDSEPAQGDTETNDDDSDSETGGRDSTLAFKVGLGLGIPLAGLIAGAVVWFLLRRRMRRGSRPDSEGAGAGREEGEVRPDPYAYRQPSEIGGKAVIEEDPVELPESVKGRVELPGGNDGHRKEASKM